MALVNPDCLICQVHYLVSQTQNEFQNFYFMYTIYKVSSLILLYFFNKQKVSIIRKYRDTRLQKINNQLKLSLWSPNIIYSYEMAQLNWSIILILQFPRYHLPSQDSSVLLLCPVSLSRKTECEREDLSFMFVAATALCCCARVKRWWTRPSFSTSTTCKKIKPWMLDTHWQKRLLIRIYKAPTTKQMGKNYTAQPYAKHFIVQLE